MLMYRQENDEIKDPEKIQHCRSWLKLLETLRQDNSLLINRLAEALKHPASNTFLESAETFQSSMLHKEEALVLLRHEIREQMDWLNRLPAIRQQSPYEYENLFEDVQLMVMEFDRMKASFFAFLGAENR
ncbi:hypothetical protein [Chitinophaga nivalis]|uniref:Uncharacterized protein n=1 Tax=Chitinophaga nivalis TaxID=2991709 RepID=A0ABT3IGD0_9BACT|nr:hypothetical protein [Chitinophaga nivalis]MCW3467295.1 hypothetical protein [Chitinophaga nivalis]MCW3483013.1 hypothetical protein [Chitinophaga nivalis]